MNKVAIITSIDYELFGDGSGIVTRDQIDTTNYLKHLAEENGVKLTIMFEYAQYRVFEQYSEKNEKLLRDNELIKKQLIELINSGHDVQLHYHAQWHNAKYNENDKSFELDLSQLDITSLEYNEMKNVLREGKLFLENLLQPYKKDYQCIAFRAGSWAVADEKKLSQALYETGFKIDTSVVPNVVFNEGRISFKYENCPHHYKYWYIDDAISKKAKVNKLIEIPIYTIKDNFALLKYLSIKSILLKLMMKRRYKNNIAKKSDSFFRKLITRVLRNYYMADINLMTADTLFDMIEQVIHDDIAKNDVIPIMLVGHSKASYNMDELYRLFEKLQDQYSEYIEYTTLVDTYQNLKGNLIETT